AGRLDDRSFPTRRSSDLANAAAANAQVRCGRAGRDGFIRFCAPPPRGANDFRHIRAHARTPASAQRAGGVDHVLAVEARGGRPVRDRRDLAGLALAVEERAAQAIVAFVADRRAGVPGLRSADLVGGILYQPLHLAVADGDEQRPAELGVVTLLVDRIGAAAVDVEPVLDPGNHLLHREWRLAGLERDVGHALELHARPRVGVAAPVGLGLTQDVGLVADRLVVDQDAVAHQVPALGLHALGVVAHGAQAAGLGAVGDEVHDVA